MICDLSDINGLERCVRAHQPTTIIADVFDTLICRNTHPENIKKRVAVTLGDLFNCPPDAFYQARQHAELASYASSKLQYGDEEIDYDDLTQRIYRHVSATHTLPLSQHEFSTLHGQIELATEQRYIIPDPSVAAFLRHQKNSGKKIILLSDFYLPGQRLKRLLEYHALNDVYDQLLVSADVFKTKRSGKLYQELISRYAIIPQQALMFGDNFHSDVDMARQHGFHAFHLARDKQRAFYASTCRTSSEKKLVQEVTHGFNETVLFPYWASLMLCIVHELYVQCLKHNTRDLFFMSREGQFVKILFDRYQHAVVGDEPLIRSHYLLVSRRSTFIVGLKGLEGETFDTLFRQYNRLSIRQFSESLGLDLTIIDECCRNMHQSMDDVHHDFPRSEVFKKLKKNPLFMSHYEQTRQQQRDNCMDYLHSFHLQQNDKPFFFFDVGWKGTIQDNLANLLPDKPLIGFYVGLLALGNCSETNQKIPLLFDYRHKNKLWRVFKDNPSIFEVLLSADHGSVKRYRKGQDHSTLIDYDDTALEQQIYHDYISPLQRRVLQEYDVLLSLLDKHIAPVSWLFDFSVRQHHKTMVHPSQLEIEWYKKIRHYENFGLFSYTNVSEHWPRPMEQPFRGSLASLRRVWSRLTSLS